MKKSIVAIATILLAGTAVAASAQEAQQADQAAQEEKKICRTDRTTGSRTRTTRICMTKAEWDLLAERTRRGIDELGRSASGSQAVANNPGSNGPLSVN